MGGRILTEHLACSGGTIPVELGAEFIHGLPRSSWDIAHEAGLAAYELAGSDLVYAQGRLGHPACEHGSTHRVLEEMIEVPETSAPIRRPALPSLGAAAIGDRVHKPHFLEASSGIPR